MRSDFSIYTIAEVDTWLKACQFAEPPLIVLSRQQGYDLEAGDLVVIPLGHRLGFEHKAVRYNFAIKEIIFIRKEVAEAVPPTVSPAFAGWIRQITNSEKGKINAI